MLGKNVMVLTGPDLNVLLTWYDVPKPGEEKVQEKKKRLKEIVDWGIPAPFYLPFGVEDKTRRAHLKSKTASIKDTVLGQKNIAIKWS